MKIVAVKIDGAVVSVEMEQIDFETWKYPEPNPEYRWLTVIEGFPVASKDKMNWDIAYGVVVNGQKRSAVEVAAEMLKLKVKQEEEQ